MSKIKYILFCLLAFSCARAASIRSDYPEYNVYALLDYQITQPPTKFASDFLWPVTWTLTIVRTFGSGGAITADMNFGTNEYALENSGWMGVDGYHSPTSLSQTLPSGTANTFTITGRGKIKKADYLNDYPDVLQVALRVAYADYTRVNVPLPRVTTPVDPENPPVLPSQVLNINSAQNQNIPNQGFVSGTLSGAQEGNQYYGSIVSGSGGIILDPNTGAFRINGNAIGQVQAKFWIGEGNGYAKSSDVAFSFNVVPRKQIKVTIPANKSSVAIRYRLVQAGNVLGEYRKEPRTGADIVVLNVDLAAGPVTLQTQVYDLLLESNTWYEMKGNVVDLPSQTVDPVDETAAPTTIKPPPITISSLPTELKAESDAPIWTKVDNSGGYDNLSAQTFREGVATLKSEIAKMKAGDSTQQTGLATDTNLNIQTDRVVGALSDVKSSIDAGNAGAGQSAADIVTALDGVKTEIKNQKGSDTLDKINDALTGKNYSGVVTDLGGAQSAASGRAVYDGVTVNSNASVTTNSASLLADQEIEVAGRRIVFGLSPEAFGSTVGGHNILTSSKGIILVAVCLSFISLVGVKLSRYVTGITNTQTADAAVGIENAVPGVAQGKTWGSAALITGVIVAFAVACVALIAGITGGVGFMLSNANSISVATIGQAIAFLEQYFPVVPFVTLSIAASTADYWLLPMYLGSATLIKFLKA